MGKFTHYTKPEDLISAPQDITSEWKNIGEKIETNSYKCVTIAVKLEINDSIGVRIRPIAIPQEDSDEYLMPSKNINADEVLIRALQYRFYDNENQNIVFSFDIEPSYDIQMQVKADTIGDTAAQFTNIKQSKCA